MKRYILLSLLSLAILQVSAKRLSFDQGWRFRLCKDSADMVKTLQVVNSQGAGGTLSSDFKAVFVPHDWSSELPFDTKVGGAAGYLPGGQGVYVKDFTLPKGAMRKDGKCIVQFDGVYHRATVWINGNRLGHHVYGYTGFEFDITPYLNAGKPNRLVVHVNREEQSRWYTGSGIYRHVWLKTVNATHIKSNGIAIKTSLSPDMSTATVSVTAEIDTAAADRGGKFTVTHTILQTTKQLNNQTTKIKTGAWTYELNNAKQPNNQTTKPLDLWSLAQQELNHQTTITAPRLWSTDTPYLYTLRTQLRNAKGKVIDQVDTPFGIRDVRFDADKGFFLNGKGMKLRGMCLHQDVGSLGVAVPDGVWERRLRALKEIGCNAVRCSHNPPSPEFLTICDTLGLLVIDEAFDKWKSGYYEPFFDQCAVQDITDMVLRDRNHPSVIVWSIGNEVTEAWLDSDEGGERSRMLNTVVKRIDPTRPTMVACQQGFQDKFGEVTDIVGYNYLEPRMIEDHQRHPGRIMLVSEAFVYYSGLRGDIVRDFVEHNPWHFVEENDFIAGSFVWAGVDYLGESSPWPAKGWCSCPFDMTLKERPQAAFYHPAWQPEKDYLKLLVRDNCFDQPAGTDHWQYPAMADTWDLPYKDDRCVEIKCYTTCDSVQFFFPIWSNPQLPLKTRVTADYPDNCITVHLPARKGKVLAVGYKGGQPVMRDSLENHGDVADVRLDADYTTLAATPADMSEAKPTLPQLSHVRLTLVDKEGRIQQMQPRRFSVETEGPIRLLGVETGDMRREGSWRTTSLNTYFGEGLVRLQSTPTPGTARLIVRVEGFDTPFVKEITIR